MPLEVLSHSYLPRESLMITITIYVDILIYFIIMLGNPFK